MISEFTQILSTTPRQKLYEGRFRNNNEKPSLSFLQTMFFFSSLVQNLIDIYDLLVETTTGLLIPATNTEWEPEPEFVSAELVETPASLLTTTNRQTLRDRPGVTMARLLVVPARIRA